MDDAEKERVFCRPEETFFTISDIFGTTKDDIQTRSTTYGHYNIDSALETAQGGVCTRVISIGASSARTPLRIDYDAMLNIFSAYGIGTEFWEILRCFGDSRQMAEGGCTHAFLSNHLDGSQECGYDVQYFEHNGREGKYANPWSQRHTGVYSRHSYRSNDLDGTNQAKMDLVIVLHPSLETGVENRIQSLARESPSGNDWLEKIWLDSASIHELVLDAVLSNWRGFLGRKSDDFGAKHDELFAMDSDVGDIDDQSLGFETLQDFRYLKDHVLAAKAYCQGNEAAIEFLMRAEVKAFDAQGFALHDRVRGFLRALEAMRTRIDNDLNFLQYSLALKNEELARRSSATMETLANTTVRDSATIKSISVLGLIYVPGTFVSGLFGMNFFDFDDDTRQIVIAVDIWVYALLWALFTGVTLCLYLLTERFRGDRKNARSNAEGSALVRICPMKLRWLLKHKGEGLHAPATKSTWRGTFQGRTDAPQGGILPLYSNSTHPDSKKTEV